MKTMTNKHNVTFHVIEVNGKERVFTKVKGMKDTWCYATLNGQEHVTASTKEEAAKKIIKALSQGL